MFSSVAHLMGSISSPKSSPSKLDGDILPNHHHHHQDGDCDDTAEVTTTPPITTTKTTNFSDVSKTLLSAAAGRQQKLFRRQIGAWNSDGSLPIHQQERSILQFDDDAEEDDEVDGVSEVDGLNNEDDGDDDDSTVEREEKWKSLDVDSFGTVSVSVSSSSLSTSSASCESLGSSHNSGYDSESESESDSSSVGSSSTLSFSSSKSHLTGDDKEDDEDEDFDDNETDFESFMLENEYKMSPFSLFIDSKESTPSKVSFDGSDQYDDENHNGNDDDDDDDDDTNKDGDDVYSDYEDDTELTGTLVLSSDDDDSLLSFLNRSFSKDMMDMGLDMKSSMFLSLSSSGSFSSSSFSSSSFPGSVSSESSMPSIIKQQIQGLEHTLDELHQIIHQDDVVSTTMPSADLADEKKEVTVDDAKCEDVAAPIIMISTSGSNSSYSSSDSFGIPAPPPSSKTDNQTIDSSDGLYEHVPAVEYHNESCAGVLQILKDYNNTIVEQQYRSTERPHNPKKQATPVSSKPVAPLEMKIETDILTGSETTSFKIWASTENDYLAANTPLLTVEDILNESDDSFREGEIDENHKAPLSPMTTDPSSSRCSIKYFKQLHSQQQYQKNHSMAGKEQQLIVDDNNIRADGLHSTGTSSSSLLNEDCVVDFGGMDLQVSPRSKPSNHSNTGSNDLKIIACQDVDCTHGPNWEEIESEMESFSDVWSSLRSEGTNLTVMESKTTRSFTNVSPEPHPTPVVLKSILRQKNIGQSDDNLPHKTKIETWTSEMYSAVTPKATTPTQVASMANDTTRNIQWSEHVLVHLIEASGRRRRLPRPSLQNESIIQN